MSLATRCPACGTTFRVVQDQLKISGGWVRCGHCHQVFNGLEALHELPADASPPSPPQALNSPLADQEPLPDGAVVVDDEAPARPPSPTDNAEPLPEPMAGSEPPEELIPAGEVMAEWSRWPDATRSLLDAVDRSGVDLTRDQPDADGPASDFDPIVSIPPFAASRLSPLPPLDEDLPRTAPPSPDTEPAAGEPLARWRKPGFMRQAEQAAQWRRPAMRAVLGTAASLLSLMLVLQVAHQFRDELAARWPASQGALQAWCHLAKCNLQPPRELARLALDSTGLQRSPQAQVLVFEADLHNSAEYAVRAPALDIQFHDLQGRTVARKVLLPEDLAAPAQGIAGDTVWHLSARLDVGEHAITGFAADLFYP